MCSTSRCAAGGPYLQQLHLAEGGPLQTQPCAHLAHPAGQQEQQPGEEGKISQRCSRGSQGGVWGALQEMAGLETSHQPTSSSFSSLPFAHVFLHTGLALGRQQETPGAHRVPPSSPLCRPSHSWLSQGSMAAEAAGRNPSARFTLGRNPLALSLRCQ